MIKKQFNSQKDYIVLIQGILFLDRILKIVTKDYSITKVYHQSIRANSVL